MPPRDHDQMAGELAQTKDFTPEMLAHLLSEESIGSAESVAVDKQMDQIQSHYDALARVFDSLPQGHFFAAGAVEKSKRHAINLTLQMIHFAEMLEKGSLPVRLNAKRILLVEQIRQHNKITDPTVKREHLAHAAKQIVSLHDEENQWRCQAIAQCLQAAEAGRLLTGLIREYRTLSAGEMLTLTEQTMGFAATISGNRADVAALLTRYQNVEAAIRADPYWSPLLDVKLETIATQ